MHEFTNSESLAGMENRREKQTAGERMFCGGGGGGCSGIDSYSP